MLGDNPDLEHIEASYDAGVLRLVVPLAERAKARRIEIGRAQDVVQGSTQTQTIEA